MKEQEVKLVIGGLLHDIGKVIFREGTDGRNHSKSGYDYLKEEVKIKEKEIFLFKIGKLQITVLRQLPKACD